MLRSLLMLALVLAVFGIAWAGVAVWLMARLLLRPPRMSDARALVKLGRLSPADLGLDFEDAPFQVIDESTGKKLSLAAWWIENRQAQGRCVVILHGYADAKVGGIAWAPLWRDLGFHILALDLRAHGESGGTCCSAGFWERHDLIQVINQLKADRPEQTRQLVLFGVSLGAAVAAAAAALADAPKIHAVILESPYADFAHAAAEHGQRLGTPGTPFQRLALRVAQWMARCDFAAVAPLRTIRDVSCPLMVIASGDDPYVGRQDLALLAAAVAARDPKRGPSVYWELDEVHHVLGICHDPQQYRRRIEEFLSAAMPG
ncbi:MAG: alpha/beta fold hydrolase [Tepidisphaeraceae bacterium]|jgi:hypothetical protein